MNHIRPALAAAILATGLGCKAKDDATLPLPEVPAVSAREESAPIPLNGNSPIVYPQALWDQQIGGTVILRMVITAGGDVISDSIRVDESSGFPALDSAAVAGAKQLRYAPALRNGVAVALPFRQPIHFTPSQRGGPTP